MSKLLLGLALQDEIPRPVNQLKATTRAMEAGVVGDALHDPCDSRKAWRFVPDVVERPLREPDEDSRP